MQVKARICTIPIALLVALLLGFALGQAAMNGKIQKVPIKIVEDSRQPVPVIELDGIFDGELNGRVKGETRLFLGSSQIIPNASGSFKVRADKLFINYIKVAVPDGMKYVASRKGKYYYAVDSGEGEKISPKNRIYFRSRREAEADGFVSK